MQSFRRRVDVTIKRVSALGLQTLRHAIHCRCQRWQVFTCHHRRAVARATPRLFGKASRVGKPSIAWRAKRQARKTAQAASEQVQHLTPG